MKRRDFIKEGWLAWLWALIGMSRVREKYTDSLANNLESLEIPTIIGRPDRDDKWSAIWRQYAKKIWDTYDIVVWDQRTVDVLPYLDDNLQYLSLEDVYQRIVLHHSAIAPSWGTYNEAKTIRDIQLFNSKFNDIGYQYIMPLPLFLLLHDVK